MKEMWFFLIGQLVTWIMLLHVKFVICFKVSMYIYSTKPEIKAINNFIILVVNVFLNSLYSIKSTTNNENYNGILS